MDKGVNWFNVADHCFSITFVGKGNSMELLPSFGSFKCDTRSDNSLFNLVVDDSLNPIKKELKDRIRNFDTGNGHTIVDKLHDGGYQFTIKDVNGNSCCLLITDKDYKTFRCALNGNYNIRSFGLNNALMLAYALAGSFHSTLLIHASLVRQNNYGYAFIAKSGTGKSTQVGLWLKYLPGCDLMNDDNPIVRVIDGEAFTYGSPWSGKTPCYRNIKARLGAITRIDRAKANSIERLDIVEAFASILPSVSSMKWDKAIYENTCNIVGKVLKSTDIYTLHCLPDRESAELCNRVITKNKTI